MDRMNDLTTGAKVVLGATVAFLIVSFFDWFKVGDIGVWSMWHGVGVVAGLVGIALLVWQAVRLANIDLEVGVTPSMVTAALAVLLLVFTFIRWVDTPGITDRTFWSWLGLALAIVAVVGAWMNMRAAGESLADVRASFAGAAAAARDAVERDEPAATPAPTPPSEPAAPSEPAPPAEAPPDTDTTRAE